jgi:hypothetical protein
MTTQTTQQREAVNYDAARRQRADHLDAQARAVWTADRLALLLESAGLRCPDSQACTTLAVWLEWHTPAGRVVSAGCSGDGVRCFGPGEMRGECLTPEGAADWLAGRVR